MITQSREERLDARIVELERELVMHPGTISIDQKDIDVKRKPGVFMNNQQVEKQNHNGLDIEYAECLIARERMNAGLYDVCISCQGSIGEDRHEARPGAIQCKECRREFDQQKSKRGRVKIH